MKWSSRSRRQSTSPVVWSPLIVLSFQCLLVGLLVLNGPTATQAEDDEGYDDDDNSPPTFTGDNFKNGGWQFNIKESETGKDNQHIGVVEASDASFDFP